MVYKCLKDGQSFETVDDMMRHLDSEHKIPSEKARLGIEYSYEPTKEPERERTFLGPLRGPSPPEMEPYWMRVKDLEKIPDLTFLSDSQDVEAVKSYVGTKEVQEYDSFFVKVEEGEYTEIWGMEGIVPHLEARVYRVKLPAKGEKAVTVRPGETTRADIYLKRHPGVPPERAIAFEIRESFKYAIQQISDPLTKRLVVSEFVHSLNRKGLVSNADVDGFIDYFLRG